jgi:hypothetical protein
MSLNKPQVEAKRGEVGEAGERRGTWVRVESKKETRKMREKWCIIIVVEITIMGLVKTVAKG